ncbi:response regulator [Vibrio furnissii]|uniref:response regulator n=1 Tax=Vibrio furnissii TaxID=29494 RepID=UPI0023B0F136|nr:response regulator [Vibrio furnissii]
MNLTPQLLKDIKVLVADDSPLVLSNIRLLLREMGFVSENIFTAKDSKTLIKLLGEETIELIICDYNFGDDLNGKQIFEEIEYLDLVPPWCTFIMLTGEKQMERVRSIVDLEPDEYIVKPYSVFLVKNRILRAFARKLVLRELYELDGSKDYDDIQRAFEFAEQTHPQYSSFLKRLQGSTYIKNGFVEEAKTLYEQSLNEQLTMWAISGFVSACLILGDYDNAAKYIALWDRYKFNRSPVLHECMAKLCLLKGQKVNALNEIKSAYDKAQNMDRLQNFARVCELNGQFDKAHELFSQYRMMAQRTYRDSLVNHVPVIRNALLSIQELNEQSLRNLRNIKQDMKRLEGHEEVLPELPEYLNLFDMHYDLNSGSYKLFRTKLYHTAKRFASFSLELQLYCAQLALLGQQVDLCRSLLAKIPVQPIDQTEFAYLVTRTQLQVLNEQCQAETNRLDNVRHTWSTLNEDNRIQGIEMAFTQYQERRQCPRMAVTMLKAMEFGFPVSLSAVSIRKLIFECEQVVQESFVFSREERADVYQSANTVKKLFNDRLANAAL